MSKIDVVVSVREVRSRRAVKPKHLPRLWCALQGLLPLEACLAAQRGELALPPESELETGSPFGRGEEPPRPRRKRT